jgi:acylphosphatase
MDKVTGYVYNVETREVSAIVTGEQKAVESYAEGYDSDTFGLTFSPAFGANDGLIETTATATIEL